MSPVRSTPLATVTTYGTYAGAEVALRHYLAIGERARIQSTRRSGGPKRFAVQVWRGVGWTSPAAAVPRLT